jgi:hypothetical protein
MKIRPLENYKLYGTSIQLDKTQVYDAIPASNQPDYLRDGKVFAGEVLLVRDEYEVVVSDEILEARGRILRAAYVSERDADIPEARNGFSTWLRRSGAQVHDGSVIYQWPA